MAAILLGGGVNIGAAAKAHHAAHPAHPRSDRIAFDRVGQVCVMSPRDGRVTHITTDAPVYGDPTSPSWSPDGSKIAFRRYDPSVSRFQIFLIHADGTGKVRLTDGKDLCADPRFSPDGKTILFSAYHDAIGHYRIYSLNVSSGRAKRLSHGPGEDGSPTWSPSGSRYAYIHFDPAQGRSQIFIASADGSGAHPAFPAMARHNFDAPAWSPDGRKIAFTWKRNGRSRIYVLRLHRKSRLREWIHTQYDDFSPAWSPDGRQIAFCRVAVNTKSQIYVANANGAHPRQISDGSTTDSTPAWRPHL